MGAAVEASEAVALVLTPFHDIVAKARNAAGSAAAQDAPMFKAAESLQREGQRALNRLHPLCRNMVSQHGPEFVNAIKGNGTCGIHGSD